MAVVVQKFGGTSVNTAEKRAKVMEKIIASRRKGHDVVVVVSAMGRKGEPYATDTFLDMLKDVGPHPAPKVKDLLTSCGEIITTCVLAHALEVQGYPSVAMTGFQAGLITDDNFTNAEVIKINPERIKDHLKQGKIVVVAGFQGCTEDLDVTTLGRGGSDTTAIALGGALEADEVIIYTDVPGAAFTDPRIIPQAPYLKSIDFYPMYLLARAGTKVIHHRAVKTAITYNRPFYIRSTFNDDPGTLIGKPGENFRGLFGLALLKDVTLLKVAGEDKGGFWRRLALDDIFYQVADGECLVALHSPPPLTEGAAAPAAVSEDCHLITAVWDQESGVKPEIIENLLAQESIMPRGYFRQSAGGSWAVTPSESLRTMQVLFGLANGEQARAV